MRIDRAAGALGARLIADVAYRPGELIAGFRGFRIVELPDRYSIQVGPTSHIVDLGDLDYLNHSCEPNTVVDTQAFLVTAMCAIAAGDDLTFFYPSTEWEMASPFTCHCGSGICLGVIAGAKNLDPAVLRPYRLNKHILSQLAARGRTSWRGL